MSVLVERHFVYTLDEYADENMSDFSPEWRAELLSQMVGLGLISLVGLNERGEYVYGPSLLWQANQN